MKNLLRTSLVAILPLLGGLSLQAEEAPATVPNKEAPLLAKYVEPAYPMAARAANLEGRVMVDCLVTAEGEVLAAASQTEIDPILREAALAAVKQWAFAPRKDGSLEPMVIKVPVVFELRPRLDLDISTIAQK